MSVLRLLISLLFYIRKGMFLECGFMIVLQTLSANRSGELKLSVETDMVSVSTHFQDLHNPTSKS